MTTKYLVLWLVDVGNNLNTLQSWYTGNYLLAYPSAKFYTWEELILITILLLSSQYTSPKYKGRKRILELSS